MFGVRLEPELDRRLCRLAEATGRSKSDVAREAIRRYLLSFDLEGEARRQSLNVGGAEEEEVLDFLEAAASTDGWT